MPESDARCVISTQTFRRALTASAGSCAEIKSPFRGVTKSGRVWRKMPESDARSVEAPLCPHPGRGHLHHPPPLLPCRIHDTDELLHTPSIAFRHLSPNSARIGYATEGALFISAQLSADAVSAFRKVCGYSSALITRSA